MTQYRAPIREQRFALETSGEIARLMALTPFDGLTADLISPVLESAATVSEQLLAPLNRSGDVEGARHDGDGVRLPQGFVDAYREYAGGGWTGLAAPAIWGGQGLPFLLGCAVQEQITSANISFALCTMLTHGAIEALNTHASEQLKQTYLTRLISGEWSGTMNLTEPQAGSDVGALRTIAEPQQDGSYHIRGTKIFITWGEHDATRNIVHLVLARLPDAPPGTRGISLFLVPKILPDGSRNDLRCLSLEHKLGLHASPTCVMSFGDEDRCKGWLVGEPHGGMRAMFTMMNHARINVGLQGVAIAERAWQAAFAYAQERVQFGRILEHPDVRRMLLSMKARTEGARALVYFTASAVDRAHAEPEADARASAQGLADLLTPVAKGWATDIGVQVASDGIQVFGGTGYVEESGAAQYLRDSRILTIYEGTNGIQAIDLVNRKLRANDGSHVRRLMAAMHDEAAALAAGGGTAPLAGALSHGIAALERATGTILAFARDDALAVATSYAELFGLVTAAFLLARQAREAFDRSQRDDEDKIFLQSKIRTAAFFCQHLLPHAGALAAAVAAGGEAIAALDEAGLASGWE